MRSLTLRSPAKLNLFLRVINKRSDGYHNIVTLFERIDLCDELRFSFNRTGTIRIRCDNREVPKGKKNLIFKAAHLLQNTYNVSWGVTVTVIKRIPVAAGLAGGSSNGATTLMALNRLWKLNLTRKQLVSLGRRIGSDVPFFLYPCSWAVGRGRGDHIKPVSIRPKLWHVLIVPRVKLYSSEVFRRLNLQLTKGMDNVNILIRSLQYKNIYKAHSLLRNDLETSILRICPKVGNVKERLMVHQQSGVLFSGSGPAVFALTPSRNQALKIYTVFRKRYSHVFLVRTF